MNDRLKYHELPEWHQKMLTRLLNASFPGQEKLKIQVLSSHFKIIDNNQSLEIFPVDQISAPVIKTIPVEAYATDIDTDFQPILVDKFNGFRYYSY